MKNIIVSFVLLLLINCNSISSEKYLIKPSTVILKGKFFKIDSINNLYIYHFKNDSIEGVFSKGINENFKNQNFKKIKLHTTYTLVLQKEVHSLSHFEILDTKDTYIDNDILIWQTGMKSKYFIDCYNISGNQINTRFILVKDTDQDF